MTEKVTRNYVANYLFFLAVFLLAAFAFGWGIALGTHKLLLLTVTLPQLPQKYLNLRTLGAHTCLVSVSTAPQNSQATIFSCVTGVHK
ncbi:MAG: hypothetical protein SCARUB_03471 [Candidatus Scalindua rubra]|uniref:Uncharacterized protein n=1 Tax=Candidatus Scalindua rubra TaxID=1872076 RepID=A0A1E3X741_9BACT|nr:MAG: hypothetical protein SCARUB_03471 [Candidatus Scalindua rubra]